MDFTGLAMTAHDVRKLTDLAWIDAIFNEIEIIKRPKDGGTERIFSNRPKLYDTEFLWVKYASSPIGYRLLLFKQFKILG